MNDPSGGFCDVPRGHPPVVHEERRAAATVRLAWPAAALPGLLLAGLLATAAGTGDTGGPVVEMVVAPAPAAATP